MKRFVKLFGIIALGALIGFSMAACGGEDGGPSSPSNGGDGGTPNPGGDQVYITLTDIPAEFNGKYVYFIGIGSTGTLEDNNYMFGNIFGAQNVTISGPYSNSGFPTVTTTCVQIANGKAVLPMWLRGQNVSSTGETGEHSVVKYCGGGESGLDVFYFQDSPIHTLDFTNLSSTERAIGWLQFFGNPLSFAEGSITVSFYNASNVDPVPILGPDGVPPDGSYLGRPSNEVLAYFGISGMQEIGVVSIVRYNITTLGRMMKELTIVLRGDLGPSTDPIISTFLSNGWTIYISGQKGSSSRTQWFFKRDGFREGQYDRYEVGQGGDIYIVRDF